MASRYWVGGTDSWNATAGSKWSTTDGGAGGSAVPTSSDDCYFTAKNAPTIARNQAYTAGATTIGTPVTGNGYFYECTTSGTTGASEPTWGTTVGGTTTDGTAVWTCRLATISQSGTPTVLTQDWTGFIGTISIGSGAMSLVSGTKLKLSSGMSVVNGNNNSGFGVSNTSGTCIITTFDKALGAVNLSGNGTKVFADYLRVKSNINYTNSGTVDFTTNNTTVTFENQVSGYIGGSFTFYNLTIIGTNTKTAYMPVYVNFTVNGALTITGNSAVNRILVQSDTLGTQRTITLGASATFKTNSGNFDLRDIAVTGGAANELNWTTGSPPGTIGDCQGNSGITFTAALQGANALVWQGKTASTTYSTATAANWLSGSTSRVPLPQDDCDYGVAYGSTVVIDQDMPRMGRNISWAGATYTGTKPAWRCNNVAQTLYGSMTLSGNMTIFLHSSAYTYFEGRTDCTVTTAGVPFHQTTIQMVGGKLTLQDDMSIGSNGTFVLSTGTIDFNNKAFACVAFSCGGSLTRSVLNSGTWTLSGVSALTLTSTGMTSFSAPTTLYITNVSTSNNNIQLSTYTWGDIVITPGNTGAPTFSGAATFANMTMASAGTKNVKFTKSTTYTMTGSSFLQGSASGAITIDTNDGTGTFTLVNNNSTINTSYINLSRCTASSPTGSKTPFYAGKLIADGGGSTDGGSNTGWVFAEGFATRRKTFFGMR